ncbi:hypothetical protein JEQ12_010813 [Ovis aries]|uniref:Uncharacterized protein n=1 Tax=Ovis aries TaxID=9940 RepID=A0A835ZW90_SHEEP|nr:hypothetical protein JEQ12_010813 [Ovis aries]
MLMRQWPEPVGDRLSHPPSNGRAAERTKVAKASNSLKAPTTQTKDCLGSGNQQVDGSTKAAFVLWNFVEGFGSLPVACVLSLTLTSWAGEKNLPENSETDDNGIQASSGPSLITQGLL